MSRLLSFILHKKGGSPSPLPDYLNADYIESSGTQYIDTGIIPNDTFKIEIQFQQTLKYGSYPKAFGCEIAHNNNMFKLDIGQAYGMNRFIFYIGNSDGADQVNINTSGYLNKHTLIAEKGKITCDDVEQTFTTTATLNSGQNMYLFMANRNGTAIEGGALKLFYCKIWQDNKLVRDYVPKLDFKALKFGLYDNVSKTFFDNAGTGAFSGNLKDGGN